MRAVDRDEACASYDEPNEGGRALR